MSSLLRSSLAAAITLAAAGASAQSPSQSARAVPMHAAIETTHAAPIVALVDGSPALVQGTTEPAAMTAVHAPADVAAFRFPAAAGHLRGFATNRIPASASYSEQPALFDAATLIPPVSYAGCGRFDSSCRSVFTTVAAGAHPARVMLEDKALPAVGPLLAGGVRLSEADQRVLMHRVLAGREVAGTFTPVLGGIDRSSVAVIPTSPMTGIERPTMIYAGASDGMLHAFCGSVKAGSCDRIGRELWAYIPRSHLGALRTQTAAVDGSPHVVEVMGDFDGSGRRSLRTILLVGAGSSVTALDITNPADPTVAWEYVGTAAAGALSTGRVQLLTGPAYFAYVPTAAGVVALELTTGKVAWKFASTAVGGVAVTKKQGQADEVVLGTAKGELWVLDAVTGVNRRRGPAFQFSSEGHPFATAPAIYTNADGAAYALAVSGSDTAVSLTQYAIAISLAVRPNPAPLDEESADSARLPIVLAFDERSSTRPLVIDKDLVFATRTKAYKVSLVTNTIATAAIPDGAALTATPTGVYATGLTSLGRVDLRSNEQGAMAASHTVATTATDDDSSWY